MTIRPYRPGDAAAVIEFALRAWAPVFFSLEEALGPAVYRVVFPDWRKSQREAIEAVLGDESQRVWVAERDGRRLVSSRSFCGPRRARARFTCWRSIRTGSARESARR